ncbi:hypothetical protein ACJMK2_038384 [Sinanodonta woodiana]|uniref:Sidoreflexin n=1 Tax=Sinanodonta woodiana TaxID=1069815 RepID=A0ABD3WBX1_SINWO
MERIDLDKPQWNLDTFWGRLNHFSSITDPRLSFYSTSKLLEAKILVEQYRAMKEPRGTTADQVLHARRMYLSAFHPDTGELQNAIGRMSFQVPGGMLLIGAMITFYRSNSAVIFWQWANQSFNALVNYTNRNAGSTLSNKQMGAAYISATSSALVTALGLKAFLANRASPLMQRFVPFVAVAAANVVNIPLMRQSEIVNGVPVYDKSGKKITESRYAAVKGISQVILSRILMCSPGMILLPVLMEKLEKTAWLQRNRVINPPLQILLSGVTLIVMVPVGCAVFNQNCSIPTSRLHSMDGKHLKDLEADYGKPLPDRVYFNKGL